MKTYQQLKQSQSESLNNFNGLFWAFSKKQLEEGFAKLNCTAKDLVSIGAGGFILKEKIKDFDSLLKFHKEELKNFRKNEKELIAAIAYELNNHEYVINHDTEPALNTLNLKISDVPKKVLQKACRQALNIVETNNLKAA